MATRVESQVRTRRWTRAEYDRLILEGLLDEDEPIELLDGQLVVREPESAGHSAAIWLVQAALRRAFGRGWLVRGPAPVALDPASEPAPDVTVVRGSPRDYARDHPARPVLIVEVARSSVLRDRRLKGGLYARAGVADYWIVNLVDRGLEVYREPVRSPSAPSGWKYARLARLGAGAVASPLARPRARIRVADLLP